jgi:methyl coenzyme M reductase subunit C-like uncharacterized protein (methanogenesis marker protein 7)
MQTWKGALIGLACGAVVLSLVSSSASREATPESVMDGYECLRTASAAYTSVGSAKRAGEEVYVACMHSKGYGQRVAWGIYRDQLLRDD